MSQSAINIFWTETAEKDLEAILEYIAIESLPEAKRVLKKLREQTVALCAAPELARIVPELREQGILSYYELVTPPWRIIYRFTQGSALILAILDGRRNQEELLLKRFVR